MKEQACERCGCKNTTLIGNYLGDNYVWYCETCQFGTNLSESDKVIARKIFQAERLVNGQSL
jgi:hypothetical protein